MGRKRTDGGRRAEIADAILRIAGREGIASLTMERLAREVGLTSGALFRHFPTRTAMLNEAAARAVALLEDTFPSAELAPLERLRAFVMARSRLATERAGIPQMIFSDQFTKALPPKGAREIREVVRRSVAFILRALTDAAARGEIRGDVPPRDLAVTVLGTILANVLVRPVLTGDGSPAREEVWSVLVALLRPPAASSRHPTGSKSLRSES